MVNVVEREQLLAPMSQLESWCIYSKWDIYQNVELTSALIQLLFVIQYVALLLFISKSSNICRPLYFAVKCNI